MQEHSNWGITYRFLVDDYPLLALKRLDQWRFESVGDFKAIIEQLLPLSESVTDISQTPSSLDDIKNHQLQQRLHNMFVQETSFNEGPLSYAIVDPVAEYDDYKLDTHFLKTLDWYQQKTGQPLTEQLWHVNHNFVGWDRVSRYIPKSIIDKMVTIKKQIQLGHQTGPWPQGTRVLSEDEWDERFGWAHETGLKPSQLEPLEALAQQYLMAVQQLSEELESCRTQLLQALAQAKLLNCEFTDAIYLQLKETGHSHLKTCIDNAECLYTCMIEGKWLNPQTREPYTDIRLFPVALDWLIHDPPAANLSRLLRSDFQFTDTFMAACLQTFLNASPVDATPLTVELQGLPLRLLLVWDAGILKLANADLEEPPAIMPP